MKARETRAKEAVAIEPSLETKITELIISRLKSGEKLPTEKTLVSELGISRSMLREILSSYETSGLITVQQGSGRYVNMPDVGTQIVDTWSIALRVNPSMLLDLLEIRSILEINAYPKAIDKVTVEQLKRLKTLVDTMTAKASQNEAIIEEDREFHQIIISSAGNALMVQLLTAFWDLFDKSQVEKRHARLVESAERHQDILDALIKKDLDALIKSGNAMFTDMRYLITMSLIK